MTKLTQIGSARPDQSVVEKCEELLSRAKSGDLRSLVYAGILRDGRFVRGYDTQDVVMSMGLMQSCLHMMAADSYRDFD